MLISDFLLNIPERANSPSAKIFVQLVSDNEESLKTKPYIFILPGGPGANHSHYEDYRQLYTHGNLVFFDPRGCGLSSTGEAATYTMDNYIDDVEVIRQLLHLNKIILLGISCGAIAALGFVLRYPSVVSELILSVGAASFKFLETAKANVLSRGSLEQQQACEKFWQGSFNNNEEVADFLKIMGSLYSHKIRFGLPLPPRSAPKYPFAYEPLNCGFGGFLREINFEEQLHLIECRTLLLAGEEDWISDKIHSELMAKKIPNNQLIIFPESSHALTIDAPELYFNAIREFLSSV